MKRMKKKERKKERKKDRKLHNEIDRSIRGAFSNIPDLIVQAFTIVVDS